MRLMCLTWLVLAVLAAGGCTERSPSVEALATPPPAAAPESIEIADAPLMRGRFTYMADAAVFEDCASGRRSPVAMEADYPSAERAYLEARGEPGAPVLVTFEGRLEPRPPMEGDGVVETIVIDRFAAVHPGEDCGGE